MEVVVLGEQKKRQKCPSKIPWEKDSNATPESDAMQSVVYIAEDIQRSAIGTEPSGLTASSPEMALRAAVLRQAMRDSQTDSRDSRTAVSWLMGEHDSCEGFSFVEICESLSFNPEIAREKIRKG